ncbi:hypothetical protein KAK06_08860 [Ideonella sp. 4Y11]|uniref:DUF4148 domain-containing protein n=1 Tax=Ideonella aquatica TaxID=2824119 RepID=A0A941BKX1_9BURK|nr:hypothetical protein [Ideonella aquatica]MBQ0959069.1 hypothetical protein [Ideonella aquatica]
MKVSTSGAVIGLLTVVLSATAAAQASPPAGAASVVRMEQREAKQEQRIQQGVAAGELTAHEQRTLQRGQVRIDAAQQRAAADGRLTVHEQRRIEQRQDVQSKVIYRRKHDHDPVRVAQPATR